ncbi:hypothetical protein EXIGLDRAFT_599779 [Exidia glandulosa HHB12029]|uniref:Uncharacterized protein n=1 Tax=Exidia glandulosa HHB12029 TaxID=1314781 RepID=A0A165R3Z1_EXIGL|nr:hypothetical protein EXIGLDRAFT_599779 [Exidia glandulosa HHB12029]
MFVDRGSVEKRSVPGNRAIRWQRGYRVGVSQQANEGISGAVDDFFGAADTSSADSRYVRPSMFSGNNILMGDRAQKLVHSSLDAILGNANAGEQEEKKFFVFVQHNAIIRIDIKIWKYNFESKGVMANSENVFCYVFCTSVVDHDKLTVDEMTFLLSEHHGDSDVIDYVDELIEVWVKMKSISKMVEARLNNLDLKALPAPKRAGLITAPAPAPIAAAAVAPVAEVAAAA